MFVSCIDSGPGALAGLRVADFSRVLAGPYATMFMADMGADVIKVEPPQGDDTRHWYPPVDSHGMATYFAAVNRNKRSIVLDLKYPKDLARARNLASTADVVLENFRPGVMTQFGLDHESLSRINPRLISCSITGFGNGAGSAMPGYDLLVQAMGGLMSITGPAEGPATKVGVALVDVVTGLNALAGVQAALLERKQSGRGQLVEINLLSALLSALVNQVSATVETGSPPERTGNTHPSIAPYEPFPTSKGELILAVGNDRQFERLVAVLGAPSLAHDERYQSNGRRVRNRAVLRVELERLLASRPAREWCELLREASVPAGPIHTIDEALEFAGSLGLNPIVDLPANDRSNRQVANPLTFSRTPVQYHGRPPDLGAHPEADWLG